MKLRPALLLTYLFAGLALAFSALPHLARHRPGPAALAALSGLAVVAASLVGIRRRLRGGDA